MDEPSAVDAKLIGAPTASKYTTQMQENSQGRLQHKALSVTSNNRSKVNEGVLAGKRITKISVITLLSIGFAELVISSLASSVVTFANGMNSLSYALISFIVFIGLYMTYYPANGKFHFGYLKVESFAALMAAMGMVAMGLVIIYNSYQSLVFTHEIKQPLVTMMVLSLASAISFYNAYQMRTIANKYNSLTFQMYAKDSIKSGSVSMISLVSVLVVTQWGLLQMDAIGSMIIAGYLFYIAYISLKQSSLILVDAWENPKVIDKIRQIIEENENFKNTIKVNSILLRPAGTTGAYAEIHIGLDGSMPLTDVELLCIQIEMAIRSGISMINRISIIPHDGSDPNKRIASKKQQRQLVPFTYHPHISKKP